VECWVADLDDRVSVAVTVNACRPTLSVSIRPPLGTGPVQA
jgi:hypothetical protein